MSWQFRCIRWTICLIAWMVAPTLGHARSSPQDGDPPKDIPKPIARPIGLPSKIDWKFNVECDHLLLTDHTD